MILKKILLILFLILSLNIFALNEVQFSGTAGNTYYYDVEKDVTFWDGDSLEASPATWVQCAQTLSANAFMTDYFLGDMPAVPAGIVTLHFYQQLGGSPANTDTLVDRVKYYWTGTYLLDAASVVTLESTDASTYIESRSLAAASYATSTALATAQADLDIITGTSGVLIDDDAITSAKFDESTAFPLASADTGSTAVARTGADGDTLETLSDQVDSVDSVVDSILGGVVYATVNAVTDDRAFTITGGNFDTDTDLADAVVVAIDATDGKKSFGTVRTYSALSVVLNKGLSFTPENGDLIYFIGN